MLHGEYMGVKIGNPLFAFLRHAEVTETILNIATDDIPIKGRVVVPEIGRVFVPKFFMRPGLGKFVEKSGKFAQMAWIGKLTN